MPGVDIPNIELATGGKLIWNGNIEMLVHWALEAKKALEYYQHADGINLKAREVLAKFPGEGK